MAMTQPMTQPRFHDTTPPALPASPGENPLLHANAIHRGTTLSHNRSGGTERLCRVVSRQNLGFHDTTQAATVLEARGERQASPAKERPHGTPPWHLVLRSTRLVAVSPATVMGDPGSVAGDEGLTLVPSPATAGGSLFTDARHGDRLRHLSAPA